MIKRNYKLLLGFVFGIICASTCVYATNTISASNVIYEPQNKNFNVDNVSDALDYLYTIGCVKGIYHHDANTQWNIELGFIPSYFSSNFTVTNTHVSLIYDSKYNKKVYANTYFDNTINDWTERFEITSTGIKTNFASALYSYKDDYDLDYYACK